MKRPVFFFSKCFCSNRKIIFKFSLWRNKKTCSLLIQKHILLYTYFRTSSFLVSINSLLLYLILFDINENNNPNKSIDNWHTSKHVNLTNQIKSPLITSFPKKWSFQFFSIAKLSLIKKTIYVVCNGIVLIVNLLYVSIEQRFFSSHVLTIMWLSSGHDDEVVEQK